MSMAPDAPILWCVCIRRSGTTAVGGMQYIAKRSDIFKICGLIRNYTNEAFDTKLSEVIVLSQTLSGVQIRH